MSAAQAALVERARAQYGEILPCSSKRSLEECFTAEFGLLMFWFNDQSRSTRMLSVEVSK